MALYPREGLETTSVTNDGLNCDNNVQALDSSSVKMCHVKQASMQPILHALLPNYVAAMFLEKEVTTEPKLHANLPNSGDGSFPMKEVANGMETR